jgi:CBS domain-containing membrane protein
MHELNQWLRGFMPKPTSTGKLERLRACVGALLGILLTGPVTRWILGSGTSTALPMLVAPMGASAVLLFALPSSPLAQPWSIVGGNLVSAAVGVTCALWIGDPIWAAALAVSIAIAAMMALRCVHPPSGAVALTAVLGGPVIHAQGYWFLLAPIGLNSLLLLAVALLFNNLTRHRYPHIAPEPASRLHPTGLQSDNRFGFTSEDMDYVLSRYNEILDVSRDDLEMLLLQIEKHADQRRSGENSVTHIQSSDR